jgi:hypothetical protein
VKVCEPLRPCPSVPVSKLPSEAVAVWSAESWLVQVTVSPTETVIDPGWKAKPWIVTPPEAVARARGFGVPARAADARGAGGGVVAGGGGAAAVVGGGAASVLVVAASAGTEAGGVVVVAAAVLVGVVWAAHSAAGAARPAPRAQARASALVGIRPIRRW